MPERWMHSQVALGLAQAMVVCALRWRCVAWALAQTEAGARDGGGPGAWIAPDAAVGLVWCGF